MKNIDSLIKTAKERLNPQGIAVLKENNKYLGKTKEQLLDYMSADNFRAPAMHTIEWNKYLWALINSE